MSSIDLTVKVCFDGIMRIGYKNGQIGLMLLIVMGVVVSIVLSIASRAFTDTTLSRQEKENNASFSIAESGVEQALQTLGEGQTSANCTGNCLTDTTGLITGNYSIQSLQSFDMYVKEGETVQIDLTGTPSNIVVKWVKAGEDPGTCTNGVGTAPAAIEVTLVDSAYAARRYYYNAANCSTLNGTNHFSSSSAGTGGYSSSQSITLPGAQKFMRIKPIYNGTTINVAGTTLASQLYKIQSQATGGDARSNIEVKRTLDSAGSVFDYALFSNTTIIK